MTVTAYDCVASLVYVIAFVGGTRSAADPTIGTGTASSVRSGLPGMRTSKPSPRNTASGLSASSVPSSRCGTKTDSWRW